MAAHENDRTNALQFARRAFIFVLPFFVLFGSLELALWKTGDSWPVGYAFDKQQQYKEEAIYGRGYFSQQFGIYKLHAIKKLKPKILVIGSSRVMQIRDLMFTPRASSFYNAGGMIKSANDLISFAEVLSSDPQLLPELLIVGVDPWWLKSDYDRGPSWLMDEDEAFSFSAHLGAIQRIIKQNHLGNLIRASLSPAVSPFFGHHAIGSIARESGSGFRQDGSRQWPPQIALDYMATPHYVDRENPPVLLRIARHTNQFTLPAKLDVSKVRAIIGSLATLANLGVEVWAFLPPFSTECYHALTHNAEYGEWMNFYHQALPRQLAEKGIHILDVRQPRQYDLRDDYMLDGFHASEVFMAHVVLELTEKSPASSLLQKLNKTNLREIIDKAPSPLSFDVAQDMPHQ